MPVDATTIIDGLTGGLAVAVPLVIDALKAKGLEPIADIVARALGPSAVDAAALVAEAKAAEAFGVKPSGQTLPLPGVPAAPPASGGGGG